MSFKNLVKSSSLATIVGLLCISITVFPMVGCSSQNTAADLVATLGNTAAAVEAINGNAGLSATITTDTGVVVTDIQNWVPGTPTQNIVQALNLVITDLSVLPIPVSLTDQALIALAVSTAKQLLLTYSQPKVAVALNGGAYGPGAAQVLVVSNTKVKKLSDNFKSQVNSIVSHDPSRANLKL
jgi:hypothetical protein